MRQYPPLPAASPCTSQAGPGGPISSSNSSTCPTRGVSYRSLTQHKLSPGIPGRFSLRSIANGVSRMYVPPHFNESRIEALHALIAQHPLGILFTHGKSGLDANHLPFRSEERRV